MNNEDSKSKLIAYWWAKAEECLASAERELLAGSSTFAVNRLYYAAFYAVSAVLLYRGETFKKHAGVRSAFHSHLVKQGLVGMEWGKLYDRLFEDRQEGDYVALISFEREYIQEALEKVRGFLMELKPLLRAITE